MKTLKERLELLIKVIEKIETQNARSENAKNQVLGYLGSWIDNEVE